MSKEIKEKINKFTEELLWEEKKKQEEFLKRLATEYVVLGKECEKEHMDEAAINNYKKALALCPYHPEAKRRIKKLEKK